MRLIDADKLKQYIDDCKCCEKCDKKGFMCHEYCELPDCVTPQWERVLNEQQPVDAVPVRHARLINAQPYGECSCCGELIDSRDRFRYCPHCGARLDSEGEKDETD